MLYQIVHRTKHTRIIDIVKYIYFTFENKLNNFRFYILDPLKPLYSKYISYSKFI